MSQTDFVRKCTINYENDFLEIICKNSQLLPQFWDPICFRPTPLMGRYKNCLVLFQVMNLSTGEETFVPRRIIIKGEKYNNIR